MVDILEAGWEVPPEGVVTNGGLQWPRWMQHRNESFSQFCTVWYEFARFGRGLTLVGVQPNVCPSPACCGPAPNTVTEHAVPSLMTSKFLAALEIRTLRSVPSYQRISWNFTARNKAEAFLGFAALATCSSWVSCHVASLRGPRYGTWCFTHVWPKAGCVLPESNLGPFHRKACAIAIQPMFGWLGWTPWG